MQYFVPVDFIWQKPICLPGTKTLLFIPSLFTFLTEPDMVVVNLFKNNAASHSKEMEENSSNDFGQNQCQSSAKFIGSKGR